MEHIIYQILQKATEKITNRFWQECADLDKLTSHLKEDMDGFALEMVGMLLQELGTQLREDKAGRKEKGLVLKEKDRPRTLLTQLGTLSWTRDYYYNKREKRYEVVLDEMIGVQKRERVSCSIRAELVNRAAEVSYAKSSELVTGGQVSRQTVRNCILQAPNLEKEAPEKKSVACLHVYADEDHVAMQRPGKERGKRNQIVPLVVVTEGTEACGIRRNRTINPRCFVDEQFRTDTLWQSVEGYIEQAYSCESLEKIYVHGDGGRWIQSGLRNFVQTEHVIDGYHFYKRLKEIAHRYPQRNVRLTILNAIRKDDVKKAVRYLRSLPAEEDAAIESFETYMLNQWDEIRRRVTLDIPGSCTEGLVSHILSERFSRNPMGWSDAALGKLSKIRVYLANDCRVTSDDFKQHTTRETYAEYAEKLLQEHSSDKLDWSMFEKQRPIFNTNSGTQRAIHGLGHFRSLS